MQYKAIALLMFIVINAVAAAMIRLADLDGNGTTAVYNQFIGTVHGCLFYWILEGFIRGAKNANR